MIWGFKEHWDMLRAEDADMEGAVDLQPEEDEVVRNIFFRTAQLDA